MSSHTPGPWVRSSKSPKIIMSGSHIEGHEGYLIGSVTGNDNSGFYASEEEAEGNARLIAAAPEMFEALDNISGLSRALRVGGPDPMDLQGLSDALEEAVGFALSAMAKATT